MMQAWWARLKAGDGTTENQAMGAFIALMVIVIVITMVITYEPGMCFRLKGC